ncbi:hypothetical protein SS50377_28474 [Spironucleus salmonicida]|uniref:Uncharacterized protein n=1 Tax=Spironucleus salmonicida TaxID=348837 RepID=V6LDQ5_9EUKA|nr:hypothetical protein SS50377_28474 [Spironucleus salmonicida]|eukprot:EST42388.1 Hypothetical protein SS50377_18029 [Spironucleus salmonicida]
MHNSQFLENQHVQFCVFLAAQVWQVFLEARKQLFMHLVQRVLSESNMVQVVYVHGGQVVLSVEIVLQQPSVPLLYQLAKQQAAVVNHEISHKSFSKFQKLSQKTNNTKEIIKKTRNTVKIFTYRKQRHIKEKKYMIIRYPLQGAQTQYFNNN